MNNEQKYEQLRQVCLSYKNDCDKKDQQIAQQQELIESLDKQLAEKGKRLADKQNTIDEINKEFVQAVHDWKALCAEKDKEIESIKQQLEETNAGYDFTYEQSTEAIKELKQNQTQLAIQELVEIERLLYESHYKEIDNKYYAEYEDINNLINSRIEALEELRGE